MNLQEAAQKISHVAASDVGVLVVHGITSTPGSMAYVCDRLATAGYNVECPLLPGHGTRWQDMKKFSWQDWTNCLQHDLDVLRKRSSKIFVLGLSLGGALSVWLAENNADLQGLVLFNNLYYLKGFMPFIAPIGKYFIPSVPGVQNDIKEPGIIEPAYARVCSFASHETIKLTQEIQKNIKKVTLPTLIFKSKEDHVLPLDNATLTLDKIASRDKELVWLENSYHVVTMDYDKKLVMDKTVVFIERLRAST